MSKKRALPQISVKWKMVAILLCFIFLFGISLWGIQVQLLNVFYQNEKFKEFDYNASSISLCLDDLEEAFIKAEKRSNASTSDMWIYKVYNGDIAVEPPLIRITGTSENINPAVESKFGELYKKAVINGGPYIAIIDTENIKESSFDFKIAKDNFNDKNSYPFVIGNLNEKSAFYLSLHQDSAKNTYVIVQRASITPISAMINAMEDQFIFICIFTVFCSLIIALVLSKLITKPIVKINKTAKNLALGKYNTKFTGESYREISELSDTLNYVSEELYKNENLQKELISNLSHDLRTPLTMIKGYGEVIRDIPGENSAENIQVIIDEASRLSELVDDMFDFSKIQTGIRKVVPELFSITESIRSTLLRYEKFTKQNGYKIDFVYENDIYVFADRGMILQAIYNLVNNAINYSENNKQIVVKQELCDDCVIISVVDNGNGIPDSELPFIWDRYYKADKQHQRATVGTGLGLSIVKGILELHNATYGVKSEYKKGSTFWFTLKVANKEQFLTVTETLGD